MHLAARNPPDWLYASGGRNRYNPAGIHCIYFGEISEVARAEYEEAWRGLAGHDQPVTTYYADVVLHRVLDLTVMATLKGMKLDSTELFKAWRKARHPTVTQLLGQAVNASGLFSAIRFPSSAARIAGFVGSNLVIFRDSVLRPDFVKILGPTRKPLQGVALRPGLEVGGPAAIAILWRPPSATRSRQRTCLRHARYLGCLRPSQAHRPAIALCRPSDLPDSHRRRGSSPGKA